MRAIPIAMFSAVGAKVKFVDAATAAQSTASKDPVTCNVPSTTGANWLLAFTFNDESASNMADDAGTWTGSDAANSDLQGEFANVKAHYRTISSEPASYDWDRGNTVCRKLVVTLSFSGINTSDPIDEDASANSFTGANDTTGATITSGTTDSISRYKVVAFAVRGSSANPSVSSGPSGWTQLAVVNADGGDGLMLAVYGREDTTDSSAALVTNDANDDGNILIGQLNNEDQP